MKKNKYRMPSYSFIPNSEYEYVAIQRATTTTIDASGQPVVSWATIDDGNNVPMVVAPWSSRKMAEFQQRLSGTNIVSASDGFVAADVDIKPRDLVITSDNDQYTVYAVTKFPNSHREATLVILEDTL